MIKLASLLGRPFRQAPKSVELLRAQYERDREIEKERRDEAAETRRESERRWYARLPIIAIATLAICIVLLTGLLALASVYVAPTAKVPPASKDTGNCPTPDKEACPAPRKAINRQMSLSSKALFGYDSTALRVQPGPAQQELDACLVPGLVRVHVIGHADCIGSDAYNQSLSERRAFAIKRYMTERGIDALIISTEGRGATVAKADPLCKGVVPPSAANIAQLERFRRVELSCEYEQPQAPA